MLGPDLKKQYDDYMQKYRLIYFFMMFFFIAPCQASVNWIDSFSIGVVANGEFGPFVDVEHDVFKQSSTFIQLQKNQLESHQTQEIILGLRQFRNVSRTGVNYGVGLKSFLLTDEWSKVGYFVSFGARFPLKKKLCLDANIEFDQLEFQKDQKYRASISYGLRKLF